MLWIVVAVGRSGTMGTEHAAISLLCVDSWRTFWVTPSFTAVRLSPFTSNRSTVGSLSRTTAQGSPNRNANWCSSVGTPRVRTEQGSASTSSIRSPMHTAGISSSPKAAMAGPDSSSRTSTRGRAGERVRSREAPYQSRVSLEGDSSASCWGVMDDRRLPVIDWSVCVSRTTL